MCLILFMQNIILFFFFVVKYDLDMFCKVHPHALPQSWLNLMKRPEILIKTHVLFLALLLKCVWISSGFGTSKLSRKNTDI